MGISRCWRLTALGWGFAEATLFFTVPDVLLTLAAAKFGWRNALHLFIYCLIGALIGGAAMYGLSAINDETARATVDSVPLIPNEMIARVSEEMRQGWLWNMFIGAVTGTPYKVYAISAHGAEISLGAFLLGSLVVRPFRWVLTILFASAVAAEMKRYGLERFVVPLWAALWIAFYVFYYVLIAF